MSENNGLAVENRLRNHVIDNLSGLLPDLVSVLITLISLNIISTNAPIILVINVCAWLVCWCCLSSQ